MLSTLHRRVHRTVVSGKWAGLAVKSEGKYETQIKEMWGSSKFHKPCLLVKGLLCPWSKGWLWEAWAGWGFSCFSKLKSLKLGKYLLSEHSLWAAGWLELRRTWAEPLFSLKSQATTARGYSMVCFKRTNLTHPVTFLKMWSCSRLVTVSS